MALIAACTCVPTFLADLTTCTTCMTTQLTLEGSVDAATPATTLACEFALTGPCGIGECSVATGGWEAGVRALIVLGLGAWRVRRRRAHRLPPPLPPYFDVVEWSKGKRTPEIGRASCRERVS